MTGFAVLLTPEQRSYKTKAANVHAADIADFVGAPGIICVVDGHIAGESEAGQRERHHRAVQQAVAEAGGALVWKSPRRCPAEKPAKDRGDHGHGRRLAQDPIDERARFRDRGLCCVHG